MGVSDKDVLRVVDKGEMRVINVKGRPEKEGG